MKTLSLNRVQFLLLTWCDSGFYLIYLERAEDVYSNTALHKIRSQFNGCCIMVFWIVPDFTLYRNLTCGLSHRFSYLFCKFLCFFTRKDYYSFYVINGLRLYGLSGMQPGVQSSRRTSSFLPFYYTGLRNGSKVGLEQDTEYDRPLEGTRSLLRQRATCSMAYFGVPS